jgi:hypothetical protein
MIIKEHANQNSIERADCRIREDQFYQGPNIDQESKTRPPPFLLADSPLLWGARRANHHGAGETFAEIRSCLSRSDRRRSDLADVQRASLAVSGLSCPARPPIRYTTREVIS